jgi:hypothetical protein
MIVARQFTAWDGAASKIRPVGYGVIWDLGLCSINVDTDET